MFFLKPQILIVYVLQLAVGNGRPNDEQDGDGELEHHQPSSEPETSGSDLRDALQRRYGLQEGEKKAG